MSISITIAGTTIEVPNTSENPNWGPAMVAFFKAVESAFSSAIGPYDIPAQVYNIDGPTFNPTISPESISNLKFSSSTVRAAFIDYTVYRNADDVTDAVIEAGKIIVMYNTDTSIWSMGRDKIGNAKIDFSIDTLGQVQFTTTAVGSIGPVGEISFKATTLTNS